MCSIILLWNIILEMSKKLRRVKNKVKLIQHEAEYFQVWRINPSFGCACTVGQLYLFLHDPMDYCLPGSSVHGISQTRILEWVAISYSRSFGTSLYSMKKDRTYSPVPASHGSRTHINSHHSLLPT